MAGGLKSVSITIDGGSFLEGVDKLTGKAAVVAFSALHAVGEEILRLSEKEVPHDTGALQGSGTMVDQRASGSVLVGYNKPYAARLHEHPEYHFQKGRKSHYLIDPIINNLPSFNEFYGMKVKEQLNV